MLNQEQEKLWQEYLEHEQVRIHSVSLDALEKFVTGLEAKSLEVWSDWVYEICRRVVDEGEDIPVRFPLFRRILFPVLLIGYQQSKAGCARWLSGFSQLLYKSPECRVQLGEENSSNKSLLLTALNHDPDDDVSRSKLIRAISNDLDFALHELPSGVLYGHNNANIEQCKVLEEELNEFRVLIRTAGVESKYADLVEDCQTHFIAYRDYLQRRADFSSYAEYLKHNDIDY